MPISAVFFNRKVHYNLSSLKCTYLSTTFLYFNRKWNNIDRNNNISFYEKYLSFYVKDEGNCFHIVIEIPLYSPALVKRSCTGVEPESLRNHNAEPHSNLANYHARKGSERSGYPLTEREYQKELDLILQIMNVINMYNICMHYVYIIGIISKTFIT